MATEFRSVQIRRHFFAVTLPNGNAATKITWRFEAMTVNPLPQLGVIDLNELDIAIAPARDPGDLLTQIFGPGGWQVAAMSMDGSGDRMTVMLQRNVP